MSVTVQTFDTAKPDDVSGLECILATVDGARLRRLVVFVKVEGDYDDGSRERARGALDRLIAARGLTERAHLLTAVGCEGVATPFGYAMIDSSGTGDDQGMSPRLVLGCAHSEPLVRVDDEIDVADRVAATVAAAAADAQLSPAQVVTAFVKVPQPQGARNPNERVRGRRTRALAALGTGMALGEIDRNDITPQSIGVDTSLYCSRVQAFGGPEVSRAEAIVVGNRPGAGGHLVAHAGLARDLIDAAGLRRMLLGAGMALDPDGEVRDPSRIAAFFLKAGPSADGSVRGARTTIYGSAISPEKHMRAAVSGLVGGLIGTTRAFTTGDPIHQGPAGGGVACTIVRVNS